MSDKKLSPDCIFVIKLNFLSKISGMRKAPESRQVLHQTQTSGKAEFFLAERFFALRTLHMRNFVGRISRCASHLIEFQKSLD